MKIMQSNKQRYAIAILDECNARSGDFHRLNSESVGKLIVHAKAWGYREPKNANGSRARYFHAFLRRLVERSE